MKTDIVNVSFLLDKHVARKLIVSVSIFLCCTVCVAHCCSKILGFLIFVIIDNYYMLDIIDNI